MLRAATAAASVRVTLDDGGQRRDVAVTVRDPGATLADLAAAVGWSADALRVDGHLRPVEMSLASAGLREGCVVALPAAEPTRPWAPAPALAVSGGLVAGPTLAVPARPAIVGRGEDADLRLASPTVSEAHAQVTLQADGSLQVTDLGSTNGTWRGDSALTGPTRLADGDELRLGAVRVRWCAADPDDAAVVPPVGAGDAAAPFLRPPRRPVPPPVEPVPAPDAGPSGGLGATPLSLTALVAPLVFAGVMVAVLGSWRFALFALMSPLMALGTWLEGKRRARRQARGGDRRLNAAVAAFRRDLAAAADRERGRREVLAPDPAEALRRAVTPARSLWERRRGDPDHLVVRLGVGDASWDPPVDGRLPDAARQARDEAATIPHCPVPLALGDGPVAIVGDRGAALAVARSLLCQAATHQGPADLAVAVVTTEVELGSWDWAKWLPHAGDPEGERRLGTEDDAATVLTPAGVPLLAVCDVPLGSPALAEAGRLLRDSADATALVLADDLAAVPAWCTTVVELLGADGDARVHHPRRGTVSGPLLAAGVSDDVATAWARALAGLRDPEAVAAGGDLPHEVDLAGLIAGDDPDALARAWDDTPRAGAVVVGAGERGPVRIDWDRAGGFGVVVGASGSGKSTLLRSVAAAAAAGAGPDQLSLVLWSAGPDDSLAPLRDLPHVAAVLRGPGARDQLREALTMERQRRSADRGADAARLLVLVDDVDTLATAGDAAVDELADLAARGSALGVSVLAAARRWAGAVARAAVGVPGPRIALRLPAESDALAVVGSRDPAGFDRDVPGRAVVAHDDERVLTQVARAGAGEPGDPAPVEVTPFGFASSRAPAGPDAAARRAAEREALAALCATVREAAARSGRRRAAPLLGGATTTSSTRTLRLADLLGLDPADVDPAQRWASRPPERTLVATLGTLPDGSRLDLDLREAALGGQGPHGVLVGATGSGKSELLRTLLTGLVADHSPEELALVLVDFKGGATFAPFARLPHVAGVITNLADDLALIDRMQAALEGEVRRRQQRLHDAGVASLVDYAEARRSGADLEPLPSLLLVVDEFAELLENRREFLDLLGTIGRVGRSLGIHLLLASQRLEEGRLRGLESHLRYRLALRTFNAADSRAILGTGDAAALPSVPGVGYAKLDDDLVRFQSGYVSGEDDRLDVLLERLSDAAPRVHQVWLPPLTAGFGLDALLGGLQPDPHRGLVPPHWPGVGRLLVPVGVVDRPDEQAQHVHALDLAGAGGNVAVVGAPQTGKSTTLRTIVCALALTHAPTEVQVYAIDHGGGGLDALADLPHVGTVAGRRDGELTARIIRHVAGVVAAREQRFAELGVDSMATLRARLAQGTLDEPFPDVFLVIDGWASLRSQHPELEAAVTDLATRGLGYGVHVLLSSNRWMELRAGLRDGFGAAVELRLSDAIESSVNRKTAETVPADTPGRGLTPDGHHLQVALPCVDGRSDDVAEGVRDLVARVAAAWAGPAAPPVRLLPEKVLFTDLPTGGTGVPVGIGEHELAPVLLDFDGPDPHLCVFGDGESGKTSVLRALVTGLLSRCSPDEARFVVVDYRRTLLEVVPDSHLLAYAGAAPAAAEACSRFRETLHRRMPGPDVTAAQLRARSWWSGPRLYLVVDDYDLVVNPTGNPLAPLVELLAQGRDLGFSVLLARRAAGTNRALDPFLQRLRDLATPGLLLSGDPAEGPLLAGMRAQPQPPGRGVLVRRGAAPELVQTAWVPELHAS